jgi:hypothetical protein
MIYCKQSSQCDLETQIENFRRVIFIIHECCETELRVYVSVIYNLPRDVWKPHVGHIRFSPSNPKNYTSTGIQFGDLIYNLYHNQ